MYTQCPECLSVFSVDARTLAQAHGFVMCGHCGAGFDCISSLADQLPPEPFAELPKHERGVEPPRVDLVVYRPHRSAPTPAPAAAKLEDFSNLIIAPRFAREQYIEKPRRWPWILACFLLLFGLAAQLGWALRDIIISDATVGPWLRQACATLQCELPPVRDVDKLHLLARDVQAHPSVANALMISATVRNDAAFTQPWPVVMIKLSDANGNALAMRRLSPAEYLDDTSELQRGLLPGTATALVFEVEDPGRQAVAFDIEFE